MNPTPQINLTFDQWQIVLQAVFMEANMRNTKEEIDQKIELFNEISRQISEQKAKWNEDQLKGQETRTYQISGKPIQLDILEHVLGRITYLGNVGMSRHIQLFVDGDGAARVQVTKNSEKLPHHTIHHPDSDAHFIIRVNGDAKADLG